MVTQSLCRSCRDEPGPSFSKWDHLFHPAFVDGTSDHLGQVVPAEALRARCEKKKKNAGCGLQGQLSHSCSL